MTSIINNYLDSDCCQKWLLPFLRFLLDRHKKQGGVTELRVSTPKKSFVGFFRPKDLDAAVELLRPVPDGKPRKGKHPRIGEACISYNPHPVSRALYQHSPGNLILAEASWQSDQIAYSMLVLRIDSVGPRGRSEKNKICTPAYRAAGSLYLYLTKMGVTSIPVACGSWGELLIPTIAYDDVAWAADQAEKLAGLLAEEKATADVRITTVAPGDSCPLPGTIQVVGKPSKDHSDPWVQLLRPDEIPDELDLFALMAEKVPAFSVAPPAKQEAEPDGDEEDDDNEEPVAAQHEDAGAGEESQPNEEEPSEDAGDNKDQVTDDDDSEEDHEAGTEESHPDYKEDTRSGQPTPTADRRTLGPVTRWDTATMGQVLAGVLEGAQIEFRSKERCGERIFRLKECPIADGDSGKPYSCSLIIGADGKIHAQCRHDNNVTWRDIRPLIGWDDHIKAVLRELGVPPRSIPYRANDQGLFLLGRRGKKVKKYQLTNFTARIVRAIEKDDGIESHHIYEVEAGLGGQVSRFLLTAPQFASLGWVGDRLGPRAVVFPEANKNQVRVAIQLLSGEVLTDKVYEHLGWRTHEGDAVYLHAGGGIGQHGAVEGVRVALPEQLSRYHLPAPPEGAALRDAIQASLRVLDVACDLVTIPLYATVWRSILGATDFALHLVGESGSGKTTLAVLFLHHWGAELDAQHIPASWLSTANANGQLAFVAKDALLLIDDFVPTAGGSRSTRKDQDADQLFRGQGNSAGRSRLRSDATLQPSTPPRSLPLSTGEETPRGQSVRARMLVIAMSHDELDWERATACQQDAAHGLYAAALAGYVRWLAPRLEEVRRNMPGRLAALREQATASGQHKRTPGIVANLAFGLELFSEFAVSAKAMTAKQAKAFLTRCWEALGEAAAAQAAVQAQVEPAQRFLGLLREAISTGQAHLAGPDSQLPAQPGVAGWKQDGVTWSASGDLLGWLDGEDLYLDPDAAYGIAQRMGQERHEPLGVGDKTLHKRLQDKGYLASWEQNRKRLTVRKTLGGQVRTVLHLRAESLLPQASLVEATATKAQDK